MLDKLSSLVNEQGVLNHALAYLRSGVSVIPIRPGGSKAPAIEEWTTYMDRLATEEEAREWWLHSPNGIAVICGPVSAGRYLLDFDAEASSIFPAFNDQAEADWPGLMAKVAVVSTPAEGYHCWLRCTAIEAPRSRKLASMSPAERTFFGACAEVIGDKDRYTLIEIKGARGYGLVPGSPAPCHALNREYHPVSGDLRSLPDLTAEEFKFLLRTAQSFDRDIPAPEPTPATAWSNGSAACGTDLKPGEDLDRNGRMTWREILEPHGWRLTRGHEGTEMRWCRPGKQGRDWSATTGRCFAGGCDLLHVFTSNAPPFEQDRTYGKFRSLTMLRFNGDFSACARHLAGEGYGSRTLAHGGTSPGMNGYHLGNGATGQYQMGAGSPGDPALPTPPPKTNDRLYCSFPEPVLASELPTIDYSELALWDGFLYKGRVSLLWSLPKAGKTTLTAHMLNAMGRENHSQTFLGQRVRPAKVLYVSEENPGDWGNRVKRLNIADHVRFLCRPIPLIDLPPRLIWLDLVNHLSALVARDRYDLVVIDTIAAFWGVEDENAAPHILAALNVLTNRFGDAGVLLDHHSRKSGGDAGVGARGSIAILGWVDISIELRHVAPQDATDRRRALLVNSRIPDAPLRTVVAMAEDGSLSIPDPATSPSSSADQRTARVQRQLSDDGVKLLNALDRLGGSTGNWVGYGRAKAEAHLGTDRMIRAVISLTTTDRLIEEGHMEIKVGKGLKTIRTIQALRRLIGATAKGGAPLRVVSEEDDQATDD